MRQWVSGSVSVLVVHIGRMRVGVGHHLVSVAMAMAADRHHCVCVHMVPIVVLVGMLMLQHFVCVLVSMAFRQVQYHSRQHQYSA